MIHTVHHQGFKDCIRFQQVYKRNLPNFLIFTFIFFITSIKNCTTFYTGLFKKKKMGGQDID
jgi:hypothetical protein